MPEQVRCDLALEAQELYSENAAKEESERESGISVDEYSVHDLIKVTRVKILNSNGERNLGKPKGDYITIEMPSRFYGEQRIYEEMCRVCAKELKTVTDKFISSDDDVILVVGLGNRNITADALGPKVISSLMITRHLKQYVPEEIDEGVRSICGIVPGVLGLTGIETGEIIRGRAVQPKNGEGKYHNTDFGYRHNSRRGSRKQAQCAEPRNARCAGYCNRSADCCGCGNDCKRYT